jgi:hypothetical protein
MEEIGSVDKVVTAYINKNISLSKSKDNVLVLESTDALKSIDISTYDQNNRKTRIFEFGKPFIVEINIESTEAFNDVLCSLSILSSDGSLITFMNTEESPFRLKVGENQLRCYVREPRLIPGAYSIKIKLSLKYGGLLSEVDFGPFEVHQVSGAFKPTLGYYLEKAEWKLPK